MTRENIIKIVGEYAVANAAFNAFVWAMRDKEYGGEETVDAWYSFRDGWETCEVERAKI